jgi:hypothetical protein
LPREAFLEKTEDDRYARGGFAARSSAAELDRMRRSVRRARRSSRAAHGLSMAEPHRREVESPLARSAAVDLEHLRDDAIECDVDLLPREVVLAHGFGARHRQRVGRAGHSPHRALARDVRHAEKAELPGKLSRYAR